MQLTLEQMEIVNCELYAYDVLEVIAFAGTGKTTTLYEYTKARPHLRFLYVAFNKSVQMEAASKFPDNVTCKTAHSLAWRQYGQNYKNKLIPSLKANTVMDVLNLNSYEDAKFVLDTLLKYLVSTDDRIYKKHIIPLARQHYEHKKEPMPDFAYMAEQLWMMMADTQNSDIGMLHDGYLKLYQLSNPILDFDCVLLDEAQDTNPVTARIVLSQPCPKILVGDPHQQIYSFRGARDAMQEITPTSIMYLTHSFRFGNKIASLANQILHCFKGETQNLTGMNGEGEVGEVSGNHAFIARTNAAVFSEAVKLYKKCKIGFAGGIQGYRFDEIVDTYYLYDKQKDKIRNSYIRSFPSYDDLKEFARTVEDWELSSRCTIVEEYRHKIPKLVQDIQKAAVESDKAQIVLTTAHKSKGLEFREVRIADDFPKLVNNGKLITGEEFDIDEFNLIYVAITRTKERIMLSESLQEFTENCSSYPNIADADIAAIIPDKPRLV